MCVQCAFCAAENGFNLSKLYLVARYHTSPEGHVHETLSRRFPQLLMKMTKCGRWRNAVSILFIYLKKKKGKGNKTHCWKLKVHQGANKC